MKTRSPSVALVVPLALGLLVGCSIAEADTQIPVTVQQTSQSFIVRYLDIAPEFALGGGPWGSQCVTDHHARELTAGLWITDDMRVLELPEPVPVSTAERIAREIDSCRYVRWVDVDSSDRP